MRRAIRRAGAQAGFTLLEVMIALSILFMALVFLIDATARDVFATEEAEKMSIATELSRAKMHDLEEMLLVDGFQETEQTEEGEFDDEERDGFTWEATIEKIELPALGGLEAMAAEGEEGAEGAEGQTSALDESPLAGLLAMGGGDASAAAGAGFIASQFELISQVLENAIRKVTLTVKWEVGGEKEQLVTTAYYTDPAAVQRTLQGLPTGGGAGGGDADGPGTNLNEQDGSRGGSGGGGPGGRRQIR